MQVPCDANLFFNFSIEDDVLNHLQQRAKRRNRTKQVILTLPYIEFIHLKNKRHPI